MKYYPVQLKQGQKLLPIADLHFGEKNFDLQKFLEIRDLILEKKYLTWIIGDAVNAKNRHSKLGSEYDQNLNTDQQIELLVKHLKPLAKANLLYGIQSGNHEEPHKQSNIDIPLIIAQLLKIEYMDFLSIIGFKIRRYYKVKNINYTCVSTHGAGGGVSTTGVVSKLDNLRRDFPGMNMYIRGHSHKPMIIPFNYPYVDTHSDNLTVLEGWEINLPAYMGYGGYAERNNLSIPSLRNILITLNDDHNRERFIECCYI